MSHIAPRSVKSAFASLLGLVLIAAPLAAIPAQANTAGTGVVINELYMNGGSAGATYLNKFVELYNPTSADIALTGMSLQYRSATGTASPTSVVALTGVIPAGGTYLVSGGSNAANGAALPTPDQVETSLNFAGGGGQVFLANQTGALTPATGDLVGAPGIIDMVGYGTANSYEGARATNASVTLSINRTNGVDTDNNAADFSTAAPTPAPSGYVPPTPTDLGFKTIEEVQGAGTESPFAGPDTLTTKGIVTAVYPTGGFNGFYIQTPGTGGAIDPTSHTASDGLFVYSSGTNAVDAVAVGDYVSVHGSVSEYYGLTQITPAEAASVTVLTDTVAPVVPSTIGWQTSETARETFEGMLLAPQGNYTVSDTYSTNQYGEILLASGTAPLLQQTEVAAPGVAEYAAALAANYNLSVTLDDAATINFLSAANQATPLPYVSNDNPVRVGEAVTFTSPVIFDFRNSQWKFQPTQQLTVANSSTVQPVAFTNTRTASPQDVGGDLKLATFNVLNYFTTLGADVAGCTAYNDRDGNPIATRSCTVDNGPRGAWDAANLQRQQDKIVSAINALDADVVGLEEIEASTSVANGGTDRDAALNSLVAALNADAGSNVWSAVPSPAVVPTGEDVIRTAFIYKNASTETVGSSTILIDSPAFANAREPLAQAFKVKGAPDANQFLAIVNHFKSKGSGSGVDADMNDGQGASNASRVAQSTALVQFAHDMATAAGTDKVFLMGDFNSYTKEDPIKVLTDAGYVDQGSKTGKYTYSFGGTVGSLDHVFASSAADQIVNDVDVWNINSGESVALEYSRFNYNAVDFYRADMYRASDHDPLILGLNLTPKTTVDLNLLNINDFHGRIDNNTVKFAGTIEQLRAEYGDANTLLGSAGDNIGASLFASSSQKDKPTIDVLNALKLQSSVGNHEFDTGYPNLTGEIASWTDWDYLGANVYFKGTTNPALPEYVVVDIDGVKVGVIGAVTEATPSLVTKSGIAMLDFGDPVTAVNRVAAQLSDGDLSNGEADVIVAEYHEGAAVGTAKGGTLENQVALGGPFAEIVNSTSSDVDVIFTGHTHVAYAWDAPIPGDATHTRPVLQTGSYGENIGQVVLTFDKATDAVVGYTMRNVPRTTVDDATLVATYPRVATVKGIVDDAIAAAAVIGNAPVGSVTADISRAFAGGSEDRGGESTIGNLVANSLVASLGSADRGGAEIGIVNPGGLRTDLLYAPDGVVTYAEANAVLPFLNNLWTTTLTGAQFKTVLEQQWQRDVNGVPITTRPFLNLGLSDNVSYTYDATRPMDDRITAIYVDGAPIDMAKEYRIGSFSFLLQGGDNFWEFNNGTNTSDSGLVDRDAWIDYISTNSPLSPSFARHSAQVTDVTAGPVAPGQSVSLNVSKLDLTSLGSPANTELTLTWEGSSAALGTVPITDGAAAVTFTVPADASGAGTLLMTAAPSGTVVRVPFEVVAATPQYTSSISLKLNGLVGLSWLKSKAMVTVSTDADTAPTGTVEIFVNGNQVASAPITAKDRGKVKINLPKLHSGIYLVNAKFVPDAPTTTGSTSNYRFLWILF